MQAHARVCKQNKGITRKQKTIPNFIVKDEFEGPYRKSGGTYQDDILKP